MNRDHRRSVRPAFSLLEVLVALAILVMGMVAISQIVGMATDTAMEVRRQSEAHIFQAMGDKNRHFAVAIDFGLREPRRFVDLAEDMACEAARLLAFAVIVLGFDDDMRDGPNFDRRDFPLQDEALAQKITAAFLAMRYDDPEHRQVLELEHCTAFVPGTTAGFDTLEKAAEAEGLIA